jgi:hypothetical protein
VEQAEREAAAAEWDAAGGASLADEGGLPQGGPPGFADEVTAILHGPWLPLAVILHGPWLPLAVILHGH